MNIIFGRENIASVDDKYTVLELDTFKIKPVDHLITAYCLVDNIPILNLPQAESMKNLHHNLLENYRKKDWNFCQQALEHLVGFWGKEMDTFYQTLLERIEQYTLNDPGPDWDGTVLKTAKTQ